MATMPDTSNLPVGDPDGRRLARQRASKVAHAARILELARFILRDSGFERSALDDLITELTGIEAAELQRAHGKVGSRKRFKHGSSHPLLDSRSTIFLFIDESGKDDVGSQSMENVFALGAISIDDEDSREYVTRADDLKQKYFGRTTVNFHEPHIRNRDREYYFQGDVPTQDAFQSEHSELMQSVNFQIFGAAIRKQEFVSGFVDQRPDPYLPVDIYWLAIAMLLERFTDFVLPGSSQRRLGRVTFESQGPREDASHQLAFARLLLEGTQWVPDSAFRQSLETSAQFVTKVGSHPMEIADLVSRELFEWVRAGCGEPSGHWVWLSKRIYHRDDGSMGRFGVKVFPDSDIRDLIERHRESVVN